MEGMVIQAEAVGRRTVCDISYIPSDAIFLLKTTDA